MTPPLTAARPVTGTRSGRARVHDVSVVLVTRPDGPPLDDLLDALAAQSLRPQRLLVTGLDPDGEELAEAREHPLVVSYRVPLLTRAPLGVTEEEARSGLLPVWRVVEDARQALPVHADHWLWFLSDDSLPEPGTLEGLLGAVRRNSRVGVVGPKLVRLDDPRLLVGVGHHLTVGGRAADTRQAALVDQGQLDLRQDVLGVPLAGSLVRSDVLSEAGGVDPAFGADGVVGLDLGWRSHLLGQRVVVAPDAVVRQGEAGLGVLDARRTRVRQRQLALARGSVWSAPWRGLAIALTSTLAALLLLLVKRPREAGDEWADVRAVLRPGRGLRARMRFRSRRAVRPRDLQGLFVPATSGWRSTLDTLGEALDPRGRAERERAQLSQARRSSETGPVSEEFAELDAEGAVRRLWSWPLVLAVLLATAVTGWRWREHLPAVAPDGPGLAGGELGPAVTGSAGLWRSALDGWRGDGLGHAQVAEPWLVPLSLVARLVEAVPGTGFAPATAAVALGWLLLAAVPAAVVTAYLALRRVTRRRWLRAGLALGWAGLAPLTVAVGAGRVGPALVHVLAPLLLAGYAVAATRRGGARRTAAIFATVLGVTLAAQWVPLVLLPATLGGLALLVVGRSSARWRGVALAVLPWLLLLPWLPGLVSGPVRVLGGAGATVAGPAFPAGPAPWRLLLLEAGPQAAVSALSPAAVTVWLTVPLWLAAVGALVLAGRAGRRAAVLVAAAVGLVGLAMLAPRLALGVLPPGHVEQGQVVTAWPGTLLSLAGAALLLAAGLGLDRLLRLAGRRLAQRRARIEEGTAAGSRLVPGAVTVAVLLVVMAGAATLALTLSDDQAPGLAAAPDLLPAVAAEQARGPAALRTLVLAPADEEGGDAPEDQAPVRSVGVDLRGAEPEPARVLRDRAGELAAGVPAPGAVEEAAAALTGQGGPEAATEALQELAVGYVLVEADADHPVVTQVDRLPGLSRVSSPEGQVLWRLTANDAARVRVVGTEGETLQRLDVTGPHGAAAGTVRAVPAGAAVEVAEGPGWHRQASVHVDGSPAVVQADGRIALPQGTHEVEVGVRTPLLAWHVLALVLGAVIAFLALPFGRVEADLEEDAR
jgi:GT2 family glycosyltransferase